MSSAKQNKVDLNQYENQHQNVMHEIKELRQQVESQQNEINTLQNNNVDLNEKWEGTLDVNSKLSKENHSLLEDWRTQKKRMKDLERNLDESEKEKKRLKAHNKCLWNQYQNKKKALAQSKDKNEALKREKKDLENNLNVTKKDQSKYASSKMEQLQSKLKELTKVNQEQAAYIIEQAEQIKKDKKSLDNKSNFILKQAKKLRELQALSQQQQHNLKLTNRKMTELRSEKSSALKQVARALQHVTRLQNEKQTILRLGKSDGNNVDYNRVFKIASKAAANNNDLRHENDKLISKINGLNDLLKQAKKASNDMNYKELKSDNNKLKKINLKLQRSVDKLQKEKLEALEGDGVIIGNKRMTRSDWISMDTYNKQINEVNMLRQEMDENKLRYQDEMEAFDIAKKEWSKERLILQNKLRQYQQLVENKNVMSGKKRKDRHPDFDNDEQDPKRQKRQS